MSDIDDIRHAMKKGEITLMVLVDFSKAFDTICFKSTIEKFYKLGFSKTFLKWLLSYLSGRSKFVPIDDKYSSRKPIHFGIPQGSILGPLIFNLYVAGLNDVISSHTNCYQYADDTTLYNHCKVADLTTGETSMNNTLTKLSN